MRSDFFFKQELGNRAQGIISMAFFCRRFMTKKINKYIYIYILQTSHTFLDRGKEEQAVHIYL